MASFHTKHCGQNSGPFVSKCVDKTVYKLWLFVQPQNCLIFLYQKILILLKKLFYVFTHFWQL